MKNKASISILSLAVAASFAVAAIPAFAADSAVTATKQANLATRIEAIKTKAEQEIDRRVASLQSLIARFGEMKKLPPADESSLVASAQTQITALAPLRAKIAADTGTTTLRADVKSIFDSYRIYALFIPKGRLLAASDRMGVIADTMTDLSTKLQTRITAAQAAGKDVTSLQATLADLNAKVSDSKTQYATVESLVTPLNPDQGDQTTFDSNKATLLTARGDIKAGTADLKAARQDITTIQKGLKAMNM